MTATQQPDPFGAGTTSRCGRAKQSWHDERAGSVLVPATAHPVG